MLDNMRLQAELQPGETLEWSGKPHPWRIFSARDWFVIPFTLVWGGIFFYGAAGALFSGDLFEELLGSFILLFVLCFVFGRFLLSAWDVRHTWYGVTNQRIMIVSTMFGQRVRSLYFSSLPEIETRIKASGRGTLLFGPAPSSASGRNFGSYYGGTRFGRAPGFYDIPDARYVFDLISHHRTASR
jgi:hypothetical protein